MKLLIGLPLIFEIFSLKLQANKLKISLKWYINVILSFIIMFRY